MTRFVASLLNWFVCGPTSYSLVTLAQQEISVPTKVVAYFFDFWWFWYLRPWTQKGNCPLPTVPASLEKMIYPVAWYRLVPRIDMNWPCWLCWVWSLLQISHMSETGWINYVKHTRRKTMSRPRKVWQETTWFRIGTQSMNGVQMVDFPSRLSRLSQVILSKNAMVSWQSRTIVNRLQNLLFMWFLGALSIIIYAVNW